jgi:tetratricopeptide (TPR) repeat protein
MEKLDIKYALYAKAMPPQPIKVKKPGWGGTLDKMENGSEPQPWHCLPFVEASTYGLELLYQYDTECHVVNDNGKIRYEWDFSKEPGGVLTGGEFMSFAPEHAPKFYLFNTRLDLQAPPGHVIRTEPHPRFYTDDTGTVPVAIGGHVQAEWWPRKLFVVFKVPPPGQRHVFRKGEPYVQLLFVPQRVAYETTKMTEEEEKRRRELETVIDTAKTHISENNWHNPAGVNFGDYYKVMARGFAREGVAGVDAAIQDGMRRYRESLPKDKTLAEALAEGKQHLDARRYNEAKAIFTHVLERDPNNAEAFTQLGIVAASIGQVREALQLMARAVQLQPNVSTYHANLGELLRLLNRFQEAEQAFRAALRLAPRDAGLLSVLGLCLAQQGRVNEGLDACRAALKLDPNAMLVHFRMGMIHAQQRQYAQARASYEAALKADPNFEPARQALRELPAEPAQLRARSSTPHRPLDRSILRRPHCAKRRHGCLTWRARPLPSMGGQGIPGRRGKCTRPGGQPMKGKHL